MKDRRKIETAERDHVSAKFLSWTLVLSNEKFLMLNRY